MRFFAQLRQKGTLKPIKPEPIAAFRAAVGADAGTEERCSACLRELEAVLAHEGMSLLQPTQPIQPLAEADGVEPDEQVDEGDEAPAEGNEQHGGRREGAWGAQLFGLQRAQLVRQLQRNRPASA